MVDLELPLNFDKPGRASRLAYGYSQKTLGYNPWAVKLGKGDFSEKQESSK
jgi:hypothetical protein